MTTGPNTIARGQRAPDFALSRSDAEGSARFYGLAGGRPTVLVLAGGDHAAATDLAARLPDDLAVHVVTRGAEGAPAGSFADPDGQVHRAYGAPERDAMAVVLDANLRVAGTVVIDDPVTARREILDVVPEPPPDLGVAPRTAPVLFVPDALSAELCRSLIDRFRTEGSVETGVETVVDGERAEVTDIRRKRRRDHVVEDQALLRELTQHIGSRVFPELQKAFAFHAGGFEGFKIGCYTAADHGHFEAHRDNLSTGTAHRRFGLTVNLNEDHDGGELRFPEYGVTRYRPAAGEALLFSGSHLHEVLPVTRGERFVLLSFVLARRGG